MKTKNRRFQKDMSEDLRWITITILLLSIGAILRMVSPNIGGISLNWNIVMYTMAIMLCRPTVKQGMGIGFVSGLVATMSSKAALPYANLISDPLAALLCAYLAKKYVFAFKIRHISVEPALLVFFTTFISGGSFVFLTKVVLSLPLAVFLYAMLPAVLLVALFGSAAGQILYASADRIFNKRLASGKNEKYSLRNIHAVISPGDFCVVTGVNGSGKTSLLLTIAGARLDYMEDIYDSRLLVNGLDILQQTRKELQRASGMVMADYEAQLVTETVSDEVDFSLENAGLDSAEILQRRQAVLEMVGLSEFTKANVTSLSGGQKQRLAIAVMLARQSAILILDEPVAAIDPEGALEIYRLLQQINEKYGTTIIVAEHDLKYVAPYATQMLVLDQGEMKIAGSMPECLQYMYAEKIYAEAIPLKWKIHLELGEGVC
jgi:ABC-type cobalt transport system, ATPase component